MRHSSGSCSRPQRRRCPRRQRKTFKARLSPVPIDVSMQATVAGSGTVTAVLTGTKLAITGTFEGLKSPATIAQIHKGPVRGVRGPERPRSDGRRRPTPRAARISGSFDLTPSRSPTSKRGGCTCSFTARRLPTATCGAGSCRRRTNDETLRCDASRARSAPLAVAAAASRAPVEWPASSRRRRSSTAEQAATRTRGLRRELRELSPGRPRRTQRGAAAGRQQLHEHVANAIHRRICSSSSRRRCRRPARTSARRSTSRSPRTSCRRTARRPATQALDADDARCRSAAIATGATAAGCRGRRRRRRRGAAPRRTRARRPRRQAPGAGGRGGAPANAGPLGVTVAGTVKNYVPVTDEMLRNQDPGDWLMARRNYQGWSHSPLTQITRDNVKELQLVVGLGDERRPGQRADRRSCTTASSISINTTNIVQALDARTGDLIWENHVGPNALIGHGGHAQHGDLPGQGVRRHDRRAAGRARRAHRRKTSGTRRSPIARRATPTPPARWS